MRLSNMAFVPEISILRASAMSSNSVLLFDRPRKPVNCRVDPCVACLTKGVLWSLKIFVDCHALSISRRYFPFFSLRFCFPGPKSCHSYEKHILYVIVSDVQGPAPSRQSPGCRAVEAEPSRALLDGFVGLRARLALNEALSRPSSRGFIVRNMLTFMSCAQTLF